jgi:hypothetical protein
VPHTTYTWRKLQISVISWDLTKEDWDLIWGLTNKNSDLMGFNQGILC